MKHCFRPGPAAQNVEQGRLLLTRGYSFLAGDKVFMSLNKAQFHSNLGEALTFAVGSPSVKPH